MNRSKIEHIKTVVIFLLIFLLFFNSYIFISESFRELEKEGSVLLFKKDKGFVLSPYFIEINSSENDKIISYSPTDDYSKNFLHSTAEILKSDYTANQINVEKLNSAPGVRIVLRTEYSAEDFVSVFYDEEIKKDIVKKIKEVYIREESPEKPVVIYENTAYEIFSEEVLNLENSYVNSFKDFIRSEFRKTSLRYSNVDFGESNVYIPFRGYISPAIYVLEPEFRLSSIANQGDLVNRVFGAGAQFVKEAITNDRDILYVYGYGAKSLKVAENGAIEYKNNQYSERRKIDFSTQLSVALAFNQRMKGDESDITLFKYEKIKKDTSDGMRFYFVKTYGDKSLNIDSSLIYMQIDVIGTDVIYYYRYFPNLVKDYSNMSLEGVTYNMETIKKIVSKYIKNEEKIKSFEFVSYVGDFYRLRPSYKIQFENDEKYLLFDFYTNKVVEDYLE